MNTTPKVKTKHVSNSIRKYGFFRRDRKTGIIEGFVEHSFSMKWETMYVRIWNIKHATHYLNEFTKTSGKFIGQDVKKYHYFISRIGSKKCPVLVKHDLNEPKKFNWRNGTITGLNVNPAPEVQTGEPLAGVI